MLARPTGEDCDVTGLFLMIPVEFSCRLCMEMRDFEKSLFARTYPGVLERNAFLETSRLRVMVPIGPVRAGHVLIATNDHAPSFGHVVLEVISELSLVLARVVNLLESHHEKVLVCEHGALSSEVRGSCCLAHAHLNVIPIPRSVNVLREVSKSVEPRPVQLVDLGRFPTEKVPYLFFSCADEGSYAAVAPDDCSQFFRRVIAQATGQGGWHWRLHARPDSVRATIALLHEGQRR